MGFGFGNGWMVDWLVVAGHAVGCCGCGGSLIRPCLFDYCLMLLGDWRFGFGFERWDFMVVCGLWSWW